MRALRSVLRISALAAGVLIMAPAQAATFVYVGATDSNEIHVLEFDRVTGDLKPIDKVEIPGVTKTATSTPMAVSPDKRLLYAANRGEPKTAATFAIDAASGKLKHVGNGP